MQRTLLSGLEKSSEPLGGIPRLLLVYWEGPPQPFSEACVRLMQRHNPDWELVRLPQGANGEFEPPPASLAPEARSDWARVHALARWGGVYIDTTAIVLAPIERWVNLSSKAVQGFDTGASNDCKSRLPIQAKKMSGAFDSSSGCIRSMDAFAIASPRGHPLMVAWQQQLRLAFWCGTRCMESYSATLGDTGLLGNGLRGALPYLTVNAAFVAAAALTPAAPVTLMRSHSSGGPLEWAMRPVRAFRSPAYAVSALFNRSLAQLASVPLLKISHMHRRYLPGPDHANMGHSWLFRQLWHSTSADSVSVGSTASKRIGMTSRTTAITTDARHFRSHTHRGV